MRFFIGILIILIACINAFADIPEFLDSIKTGNFRIMVPVSSDTLLNRVYAEILLDSISVHNDTGSLKAFLKQEFPGRNSALKNCSRMMSDSLLDILYKKGIEIENTDYLFRKNPDDLETMKAYVRLNKADAESIAIANADILGDFALIFAVEYMKRPLLDTLSLMPAYAVQCSLLIALAEHSDALPYFRDGASILEYVKNKELLLYAGELFRHEQLSDKMEYYAGRYFEKEGNYTEAVRRYVITDDPEAVIRNIALAGEQRKGTADSILAVIDYDAPEVKYHKAKMLAKKGDRKGFEIMEDLIDADPVDYYSTIAMKLTGRFGSLNRISATENNIDTLYLVMHERAYDTYFWRYISLLIQAGSMNALQAADMSMRLEVFNKAMEYGYKAYYSGRKNEALYYLFPVPYEEYFRKAAEKYNVDIALLYAMAREESWFNPAAVSPVGAMGIMQLMNFVYDSYYDDKDYLNPEKNINAGTAHIAEYLSHFPDNLTFGIMSYNAGVGAVKKWQRKYVDWELYLECVPYRETRIFVKRVLRSYIYYKYVLNIG